MILSRKKLNLWKRDNVIILFLFLLSSNVVVYGFNTQFSKPTLMKKKSRTNLFGSPSLAKQHEFVPLSTTMMDNNNFISSFINDIANDEMMLSSSLIIIKEDKEEEESNNDSSTNEKSTSISSKEKRDPTLLMKMGSLLLVAASFLWVIVSFGGWKYYLAGGLCAGISHAIATPIDVVKTRRQIDPKLRVMNIFQVTKYIIDNEGIQTLLAGLVPTTIGYFLEGSLKFGIYEFLKPIMMMGKKATSLQCLKALMICGAISGIVASAILCPIEAIRISKVKSPDDKSSRDPSVLWKGFIPMLYKQVPYTISKNVSFDILTKAGYAYFVASTSSMMNKVLIPVLCAIITSIIATVCSQPGDVIVSIVNANEGNNNKKTEIIKDFMNQVDNNNEKNRRQIIRFFRCFFMGMKTRLLHVGLIVTTQLTIYDMLKKILIAV
mmetsp:Transcript_10955/g.12259  ORF Transcript_10955/g.12259 Transcript_10955/m.12259 type:complete len:436 (+) Transcript_10955:51-1358(+)